MRIWEVPRALVEAGALGENDDNKCVFGIKQITQITFPRMESSWLKI